MLKGEEKSEREREYWYVVWGYTSLPLLYASPPVNLLCLHLGPANQIGNHTIVYESELHDKTIALLQSVLSTV